MKIFSFKLLIFSLLFSCTSTRIYSSHVVGGDFKITMTNNGISSSSYDIQLRLYRDDVNANINAFLPLTVSIGIYQLGTNILQTTKELYLDNNTGTFVTLGDACFTPNPLVLRIEEGVYNGSTSTVLPNFSLGYYIQYQMYSRNSIITNLIDPDLKGISVFAIIPDPALGQNSSPDFGDYPNDAYFCLNSSNSFIWPVTEPDGDSLVFSLVQPLNSNGTTTGSSPGSGPYPFYPTCLYAVGYSLTSLGPGTPPMTINSLTGEITGSPAIIGNFVFAVRVEEYRNGVKIGEVRRDVQYAVEPLCTTVTPPFISINNDVDSSGISSDTLSIDLYVSDSFCFDLEFGVKDEFGVIIDTSKMYLKLTSNNFDLAGSFVQPNADTVSVGSNNTFLSYYNWENISGDTVFFNLDTNNSGVDSGYIEFTGFGYFRYCWQAPCEGIDSTFYILIDAYSKDCSGINQSQKNMSVNVQKNPPIVFFDITDSISITLDNEICIDLLATDTANIDDTLAIRPSFGNFDFDSAYVPPLLNSTSGEYYYENFNDTITTFSMVGFSDQGNIYSAVQTVGLRFCLFPDCDFLQDGLSEFTNPDSNKNQIPIQFDSNSEEYYFNLFYDAFSTVCGSDTVSDSTKFTLKRKEGRFKDIPNVFSPDGDGTNDVYTLNLESGVQDPCYDVMDINIYNRWGQKVYNSNDVNFEWDGKLKNGKSCDEGSYLVIIKGKYGSTYIEGVREPNIVEDEFWIQLFRK